MRAAGSKNRCWCRRFQHLTLPALIAQLANLTYWTKNVNTSGGDPNDQALEAFFELRF
jgi:hypothetical protein